MNDLNHAPHKRVLLLGEYGDNDRIREIWEWAAKRHACRCEAMSLANYAGSSDHDCLTLVNLGRNPVEILEPVIFTNSRKVLYFPPGGTVLAADEVIKYCQHNRVCDVIGGDPAEPEEFARRIGAFRGRLRKLFTDKDLYEPILHEIGIRAGDTCFIATTFEDSHRSVFDEGVEAAMDGLGIRISNPGSEHRLGETITDKIRKMIRDAKIVIANIRQTDDGRYNPNVFYELGYSQALNKIILPFRHVTDTLLPPIDIRDNDYFLYEDAIDLALKLYWGLVSQVTNGWKLWHIPIRLRNYTGGWFHR